MTLKKTRVKKKYVRMCPKCRSINVEIEKTNPLHGAAGVPWLYVCQDCHFSEHIFPEIEVGRLSHLKKKHPKETKAEQIDTTYGEFEVRVIWKIMGPLFILMGMFAIPKNYGAAAFFLGMGAVTIYFAYFKKRGIRKGED